DQVALGIRPEHFEVHAKANTVSLVTRFVEALGSTTLVYATIADSETNVAVQLPGAFPIGAGETMRAGGSPSAGHLFDASGCAFPRIGDPVQEQKTVPLARRSH